MTDWIRSWVRGHGLPTETADRLDLCSAELVTNIIVHGYGDDGAAHQITLTLERADDVLRLEIADDGRPFNPLEAEIPPPAATLDEARVGGWGIAIVRRVADDLRYERTGGMNRLTVLQRCHPAAFT